MIQNEKKVNHLLHFIFSCCSFGCWVLPWSLICLSVKMENHGIRKKNKKYLAEKESTEERRHKEMMDKINAGRYVS